MKQKVGHFVKRGRARVQAGGDAAARGAAAWDAGFWQAEFLAHGWTWIDTDFQRKTCRRTIVGGIRPKSGTALPVEAGSTLVSEREVAEAFRSGAGWGSAGR